MLLHLRSTPTITLMLILTALTRLWTGRLFSVSVTPFCSLSNYVDLFVICIHVVYSSDLRSSLSNH